MPVRPTHLSKVQTARAPKTRGRKAAVLFAKAKHKRLAVAAAAYILLVAALIYFHPGDHGTVGAARLHNLQTYSNLGGQKTAKTSFKPGEPVQIGFNYSKLSEAEANKALVRFKVTSQTTSQTTFETQPFRLSHLGNELFVDINNTNLPPDAYKVQLINDVDTIVGEAEYKVEE